MPLFETRDLAIYASTIGTLNGLWTLYHGVIRDRPRIVVRAREGVAVPAPGLTRDIFVVTVSNRGRRAVNIEQVARLRSRFRGDFIVLHDFVQQLSQKPRLDESQSHTFVQGAEGGHTFGALPTSHWYVIDGAGRVHPLRERYRLRLLAVALWPLRRSLRWRARRAG